MALYLRADLHRYHGGGRFKFWRHFLFTPGFKYTVLMRWTGYARTQRLLNLILYPPLKLMLIRCRYKYGIAIPEYTDIGPGLFINRFGGIYLNGDVVLGANINLAQMAMLGQANRGDRAGSPIVGDRVFIAVGSALVGRIEIGDDVVIGVNSVVTRDVPAGSVVGGIPAKILSQAGSEGYINRQVPEPLLQACYQARSAADQRSSRR